MEEFKFEIIKGSANYLLFCLNQIDGKDDHTMTAKEQLEKFGPCAAVSFAPRKKALINFCRENNLQLI